MKKIIYQGLMALSLILANTAFLEAHATIHSFQTSKIIFNKKSFNDEVIISIIQSKLSHHYSLSRQNIRVKSKRGYVTVMGTVNTASDAKEVVQLIETVPGVQHIDISRLRIKSIKAQPNTKNILSTNPNFI